MHNDKFCTGCREDKSLSSFKKRVDSRDGLAGRCRECVAKSSKAWRAANAERCKKVAAQWRSENRARDSVSRHLYAANHSKERRAAVDRYQARHPDRVKATYGKWRANNLLSDAVKAQRRRARQSRAPGAGVSVADARFALASTAGLCSYCGDTLPLSLDHIEALDVGGAHEPGNTAPACGSCNSSKNATPLLLWLVMRAARRRA